MGETMTTELDSRFQRFPLRNQVLYGGQQRIVPVVGTYSTFQAQLVQWRSRDFGRLADCCLHLRLLVGGQPVAGLAGGVAITGQLNLKYGAGNVLNSVQMDLRNGAYQLPPCDSVEADMFFATALTTEPMDVQCSLVEGLYPGARPPTWSRFDTLTVAGSPDTFTAPRKAAALDVQLSPSPSAAPGLPIPANAMTFQELYGGATRGQTIFFSMDGAADYPKYSPVVLENDPRPGAAAQPYEWEVRAFNADSFYRATFFLAL